MALVAEECVGAEGWLAGSFDYGHGRDAGEQGEGPGPGDVVDVGRGGEELERGAASGVDQVVVAARLAPVDRELTSGGVLFFRADAVQLIGEPILLPPPL
ncbi:hypothetical protein [Streptomyces sp. NPDC088847]|uniref:hypothetical protein n=1 Tax=Streptomyces sp. NPDC088847 TaxID=3365909 RepID=UPI0038255E62